MVDDVTAAQQQLSVEGVCVHSEGLQCIMPGCAQQHKLVVLSSAWRLPWDTNRCLTHCRFRHSWSVEKVTRQTPVKRLFFSPGLRKLQSNYRTTIPNEFWRKCNCCSFIMFCSVRLQHPRREVFLLSVVIRKVINFFLERGIKFRMSEYLQKKNKVDQFEPAFNWM